MQSKKFGLLMILVFMAVICLITSLYQSADLSASVSNQFGLFITLLTDSAGHKGFLITLVILGLLFLKLPFTRAQLLSKGLQLGVILLIGFTSKTALKELTESPRPYTEWLAQQALIESAEGFYELNSFERDGVIIVASESVSSWRTLHWQGEKDYSFPSGHTIFVAICIVFFGGLFAQYREWLPLTILMFWASGVAYSRLWIGMHRPEDLLASIAFVTAVYLLVPPFNHLGDKLAQHWPNSWPFKLLPDRA